MVQEAE